MEKRIVFHILFVLYWCGGGECLILKNKDLEKCRKTFTTAFGLFGSPNYTPTADEPGDKVHDVYHLKLTNTGPVVLDSIIDFRAQMYDEHGHVADPKLFLYMWQNDATFKDLKTENGFDANLTKQVFRTDFVDPRIYTMQVCVYDRETQAPGIVKHTRVAQGRSKFVLTESLNGYSHVTQNLKRQLNKTVFATNRRVHFAVNLTDRFSEKTESKYFWYQDQILVKKNVMPEYSFKIQEPMSIRMSVSTVLMSRQSGLRVFNNITNKPNIDFNEYDFTEKNGEWRSKIIFIDEITAVNITMENSTQIDEIFTVNVTYQGSNATNMCWDIWKDNENHTEVNSTECMEISTSTETVHTINVKFSEAGQYYMNVSIENDVSIAHHHTGVIHVSDPQPGPDPGPSKSLKSRFIIPAVFICLGVTIIIISTVYIVRSRKKKIVEVADFDFHPSLHEQLTQKRLKNQQSHPLLTWSKGLLTAVFRRDNYTTTHTNPDFRPTTARSYGAMMDSDQIL